MNDFIIPFALDSSGNIVPPHLGNKDTAYYCPECNETIIFRKGIHNKPHFSHKSSSTCNQETIIHKTAKLLIVNSIKEWKAGISNPPIVLRKCPKCGSPQEHPFSDTITEAKLECRFNSFILDVALFSSDIIEAAIEICVTHSVGEYKEMNLSIPFIELDGNDVINNPNVLIPINDKLDSINCFQCKENEIKRNLWIEKYFNKINIIAQQTKIKLPLSYFRYGACNCWKCKKEIIVFCWPNSQSKDNNKPIENHIPYTIQYRYSKSIQTKYWVNICPFCDNIQGNHFLYSEPEGPFFSIDDSDNSTEKYYSDLVSIADYKRYIDSNFV